MAKPEPILEVEALSKAYANKVAIEAVSFELYPGEIVGLLGPNGAGKTTTIEGILGLRKMDSGEVRIQGIDAVKDPIASKQQLGAQLQSIALPDAITPLQALNMAAAFYTRKVDPIELLSRFQLADKSKASFQSLSEGQQQRLSLALAFIHAPKLLLLDEPTAGLDPHMRRSVHELLVNTKEQGCGVLLSTHLIREAEEICDRILLLSDGNIIAAGTPAELISKSGALCIITARLKVKIPDHAAFDLDGVTKLELQDRRLIMHTADPDKTLMELLQLLLRQGNSIEQLETHKPNLESAYLSLTGQSWQSNETIHSN